MAKGGKSTSNSTEVGASLPRLLRWPIQTIHGLLFDHHYFRSFFVLVLLGELILGCGIIQKIAYTEIDWIAYMEEVKGFLDGQWDYAELKGQTGPLVYPAGFVYLYSALYYLTNLGTNILLAQYIFLGLYLAFIAVLMLIYHQAKMSPPWVFLLLCASRRIHSIFMLRCFNDCFAMFFLYVALYLILKNRWTLGCIFVSLALSIKMNILLFMPALGILLLQRFGVWRTVYRLLLIVAIQVVLAIPFLMVHPYNYFHCAFQFDRSFFYIWTVNLKILPEDIFLSKDLAKGLLAAHVIFMIIFLQKMSIQKDQLRMVEKMMVNIVDPQFFCVGCFSRLHGGLIRFILDMLRGLFTVSSPSKTQHPSAAYIVTLMFVMNFIGIVFARSLHYQFYVWYFHTLPFLLFLVPFPTILRILILIVIEYSWNVYPATANSSGLLIGSHLTLLLLLLIARLPSPPTTTADSATSMKKVQ